VAVEKLAFHEFAEIASRQETLGTISCSLLDIFYHPIFYFFQKNRVFQQPHGFLNSNRRSRSDAFEEWRLKVAEALFGMSSA
jgi:hypothetical protein